MASPTLTRNRVLVIVLGVAAALAAALIVVSLSGGDDSSPPTTVQGAAATEQLLAGIPQQGNVLGDPKAPVTIIEYADFECPFCGAWARDTFPAVVDEYVRPGKAKIVYNGLAFISQDSVEALQAAQSAGKQSKLWNLTELIYHNQGAEGTGWVTDDFLRAMGEAVPGLDVDAMMAGRSSPEVTAAMAKAQQAAVAAGIDSTPTFQVGRTGGELTTVTGARPIEDFRKVLDPLLAGQ